MNKQTLRSFVSRSFKFTIIALAFAVSWPIAILAAAWFISGEDE